MKLPPEVKLPVDFTAILVAQCQAASPTGAVDKLTLRLAICFAQALNALMLLFHRWREGLVCPAGNLSQRPPAEAPANSQPPVKQPSNVSRPRRFGRLPQRQPETAMRAEQLQPSPANPEVADCFARGPQARKILRQKTPNSKHAPPPPTFLKRKPAPAFARPFCYDIKTNSAQMAFLQAPQGSE
jgi:hypothetical protein